jgi:hypothetical protein
MAKKQKSTGAGNVALAGAGIAALAVATYFFTGDRGVKNKKHLRGWAVRMKGEVLEKIEDAREVTEPIYKEIVDKVAKAQMVAGSIPKKEILELAEDLKKDWKVLTRTALGKSKKGKSASKTKKAAPKAKSTKKVTKK